MIQRPPRSTLDRSSAASDVYKRQVLAQILKVEQHPDADRLVLATVDYGAAEPKVAVTGAPNLLPYVGRGDLSAEGLYAPYALDCLLYPSPSPRDRTRSRMPSSS